MFITVILPFVDLRYASNAPPILDRPTWPAARGAACEGTHVFQRNFGKIIDRPLNGLPGWIGESAICEIRKSVKIRNNNLHFKRVIKRMYYDGTACGYFSFSFSFPRTQNRPGLGLEKIQDIVSEILQIKVYSRHFMQKTDVDLTSAGKALYCSFALGSSALSMNSYHAGDWKPEPRCGYPLVFVEGKNITIRGGIGKWAKFSITDKWNRPQRRIFHKKISDDRRNTWHIFVQRTGRSSDEYYIRKTKIVLNRLYMEAIFLANSVDFMAENDICKLKSIEKKCFVKRLNDCLVRIYGRKRAMGGLNADDYASIRSGFFQYFDSSRLDDLVKTLNDLGIRKNLRGLLARSELFPDDSAKKLQIILGGSNVNNTINQTGNQNTVITGDNNSVNTTQNNELTSILSNKNDELIFQLNKIKGALNQNDPEVGRVILAINSAIDAAHINDKDNFINSIKPVASWLLERVNDAANALAVTAIRATLGV